MNRKKRIPPNAWRAGAPDRIRWIVKKKHGIPDWAREGEVPTAEVPLGTTDAAARIVAVRQGLGTTTLACVVGDRAAFAVCFLCREIMRLVHGHHGGIAGGC